MSGLSLTKQMTALMAAFVIASIAAVTSLSYVSEGSSSKLRKLLGDSNRVSQTLFDLIEAVGKVQGISQKLVREKDPDVMERLIGEQRSAGVMAEAKIGEAQAQNTDVGSAYHALVRANQRATETVMLGEHAQAQQLLIEESDPAFEALLKGIGKAQQESQRAMDAETALAFKNSSSARMVTCLLLASVLTGLVVFAGFALRGINARLRSNMEDLRASAEQMTSAAAQVSSAAQTLAQGASQQARTLDLVAASTAEIDSETSTNAADSQEAAQLTQKSTEAVLDANGRLKQMQHSMQEISDSSGKVSKIIQVIDGIAFQTNILALNAAVEAARAGEAGLGFAVVADEVRNLAQRCSQAAKDTSELIEQSMAKSNEGSQRLNQVATAIASITGSTEKVKSLIDKVNVTSRDEARRTQALVTSVSEIQQVTQSSAASAEESAAAGEELSAQAIALHGIVRELSVLVDGAKAVAA